MLQPVGYLYIVYGWYGLAALTVAALALLAGRALGRRFVEIGGAVGLVLVLAGGGLSYWSPEGVAWRKAQGRPAEVAAVKAQPAMVVPPPAAVVTPAGPPERRHLNRDLTAAMTGQDWVESSTVVRARWGLAVGAISARKNGDPRSAARIGAAVVGCLDEALVVRKSDESAAVGSLRRTSLAELSSMCTLLDAASR